MAKAIMVEDPATGDLVTLRELGRRYGLSKNVIYLRRRHGKRGADLVAPHSERGPVRKEARSPYLGTAYLGNPGPVVRVRKSTLAERREIAREVLATPAGRLSAVPFKRYAEVTA